MVLPTSDQVGFSPRKHSPDGATAHIRLDGLLLIYRPRLSCRRSNLVKIIPEPSATRNAMFKFIRSNTEIAITPPRIAEFHSNLVQSFIRSQAYTTNFQSQRSRSQHKVMYQHQKRYNTVADRLGDFKLGSVVIKAAENWRGVGRPQVAMRLQLPRLLVLLFSLFLYYYIIS